MGFGVDLFDVPMAVHLLAEAANNWVDVSRHKAWEQIVERPLDVTIVWNDYGTGRASCPDAVKLASDTGAAWITTGVSERHESKLSIQIGTDDLMVVFDEKFATTLGLFDPERGRVENASATLRT